MLTTLISREKFVKVKMLQFSVLMLTTLISREKFVKMLQFSV